MTDHTLSPQSVVDGDRVLDAAAAYLKQQYGASHGLDHPTDRERILSSIPPAPALAGGEVLDGVARIIDPEAFRRWEGRKGVVEDRPRVDRALRKAGTILAALSPEAPAREGVDWQPIETALQDGTKIDLWGYWPEHDRWVRTPDAVWDAERCDWKVNGFYAGAYVHPPRFTHWRAITGPAALTPRHEAPAEGTVSSEAELKRIVKDMITHRRAGDDLMADDVANCLWPLLRVHSSAPEAREGEAWRVERTEYAVKFWVGVQGFTVATRGDDPDGGEHLRLMEKMLRRALGRISAALKAEDAK